MTGLTPTHVASLHRLSAELPLPPPPPPPPPRPISPPSTTSPTKSSPTSTTLPSPFSPPLRPNLPRPGQGRVRLLLPSRPPRRTLRRPPHLPGFPDWHAPIASCLQLRASLDLPIAAVSLQIARNSLWLKSWGPKPSHPEKPLRIARNALKKAPFLIPLFNYYYIPSNPSLARNPILFVDEDQIFCCGSDLSDFFERKSLFVRSDDNTKHRHFIGSTSNLHHRRSLDSSRTPRWVEFWSDSATYRGRRNLNSSFSSSLSVEYHLAISKQRDLWHYMDNMRHVSITSSITTLQKPPTQTLSLSLSSGQIWPYSLARSE
ncbi:hypothetical protein Syun_017234 [Stephania yunnanensis]|uniref:Uncharacterized protein n=1 Tax=Stephania yunnanensis TaxID=152371 RepID=A0AAP0P268_9MAGN